MEMEKNFDSEWLDGTFLSLLQVIKYASTFYGEHILETQIVCRASAPDGLEAST